MKLSLATLAAFAIAATLGAGAGVGQGPPASYIVVFKNGVATDAKTLALEGQMGFTARNRFHTALHGFAAALTGPQLARIQQDADVAFASEDRQVQATDAPLAPGETAPTGIRRVNAATTTTTQGTAASVNVAVIDTGIGLSNTDLNVQPGTNCVSPGSAPEDDNGHGTHVSGTIAAKNTGSRVVGVAPDTQLWAVKVLNAQGNGTWAQVICGIDWVTANAAAHNIHVASMSLTGSGTNDNNCGRTNLDALHLAICNSEAAGVTYVVAAGNSGANFSTFVPAAYPEAVTVTAVSDWDGQSGGTAGAPSCFDGILESDDAYASFSNFASTSDSDCDGAHNRRAGRLHPLRLAIERDEDDLGDEHGDAACERPRRALHQRGSVRGRREPVLDRLSDPDDGLHEGIRGRPESLPGRRPLLRLHGLVRRWWRPASSSRFHARRFAGEPDGDPGRLRRLHGQDHPEQRLQ